MSWNPRRWSGCSPARRITARKPSPWRRNSWLRAGNYGTKAGDVAIVYDWCYPHLSAAQRTAFIGLAQRLGCRPDGRPLCQRHSRLGQLLAALHLLLCPDRPGHLRRQPPRRRSGWTSTATTASPRYDLPPWTASPRAATGPKGSSTTGSPTCPASRRWRPGARAPARISSWLHRWFRERLGSCCCRTIPASGDAVGLPLSPLPLHRRRGTQPRRAGQLPAHHGADH